jgi:hypothetical protein
VARHPGTAVDGIAERRGENDAGERGEPGHGALRQGRGLAADERRLDRDIVAQVDQEGQFCSRGAQ